MFVSCYIPFFSLTSPTAQLLWEEEGEEGGDTVHGGEEGEVEELDYDETMEDLDLHPTGNIDEGDGDETRKQSVASDSRPGRFNLRGTCTLYICACAYTFVHYTLVCIQCSALRDWKVQFLLIGDFLRCTCTAYTKHTNMKQCIT